MLYVPASGHSMQTDIARKLDVYAFSNGLIIHLRASLTGAQLSRDPCDVLDNRIHFKNICPDFTDDATVHAWFHVTRVEP